MCSPEALTRRHLEVIRGQLGLELCAPAHDGSLVISSHGYRIIVVNHAPHDPEYLQLLCFLDLDPTKHEAGDIESVTGTITRKFKTVKVHPIESGAMFSAESVIAATNNMPSRWQLAAVLPRLLQILHGAIADLGEQLEFRSLTRDFTPPSR